MTNFCFLITVFKFVVFEAGINVNAKRPTKHYIKVETIKLEKSLSLMTCQIYLCTLTVYLLMYWLTLMLPWSFAVHLLLGNLLMYWFNFLGSFSLPQYTCSWGT